jgi:hypothetical protein
MSREGRYVCLGGPCHRGGDELLSLRNLVGQVVTVGGERQQLRPELHRVRVGVSCRAEELGHRAEFLRSAVLQRNACFSRAIVISPDHISHGKVLSASAPLFSVCDTPPRAEIDGKPGSPPRLRRSIS